MNDEQEKILCSHDFYVFLETGEKRCFECNEIIEDEDIHLNNE